MKIESFNENLDFKNDRIVTKVLLETSFSKEIRILLKQGQIMREHKAHFPIIVHVLDGEIHLGIQRVIKRLRSGDFITLEANIPHDLTAIKDTIIRLTLSKLDKLERVERVATD